MKVLQVINSLATGGAEKLILESVPKYNKKGISMEVLLLDGSDQPFLTKLKGTGVVVHSLSRGWVYSPFHTFGLMRFIKKYDLVHVHLFPALYWVALAKALSFTKTKLVFTEHNTSNRRRGWLFKISDRWAYARYDKIVMITMEVGTRLKEHLGASEEKFELIHNGIDVGKFREAAPADRTQFQIDETTRIIIQVSSFTEQKDQSTLIRSLLRVNNPSVLLLVGTGPLLKDCRQLAKELGLEDRIQFLGIRMDVPQLLKMADVVVLSSHFEGLSLSSIEALASGTPFVASRVPGLIKIVENAGLLFPEADDNKLADVINQLFENPRLSEQTSQKGLERASLYDIEWMIDKHCNLYRELCQNPS